MMKEDRGLLDYVRRLDEARDGLLGFVRRLDELRKEYERTKDILILLRGVPER